MFYGYSTKEEMIDADPDAEAILANRKTSAFRKATPGKECTGSIDGKTFLYSDGTSDEGQECTKARAVYDGDTFAWIE